MRTTMAVGVALLLMLVSVPLAGADTADFALFDVSNPANRPDGGAVCWANSAFTWHLSLANWGDAGVVRITYKDGDIIRFPIAAGASLSMSQAGTKGASGAIRVSSEVSSLGTQAQIAGALSAIGQGNPKCASCDAVSEGGIGDANCDKIVPN